MHRPDLLVMDEPTQGLDPLVQQTFYAMLDEERERGTTVFLSSHVMPEVERVCDRVGIIREGRLATVSDIGDLKSRVRRRIELHFEGPAPKDAFARIPGVRGLRSHGDELSLEIEGSVDPVIKEAARHTVVNIETQRAEPGGTVPHLLRPERRSAGRGGSPGRSERLMSGLFAKTLRDQRRALIGWGIGLAAIATMYAAFYPSIEDSAADFTGYLEKLPEAVRNVIGADFTTPAGYLRSETFSLLGPILFLVFAIGAGARAIAGEEEDGTLDLLLSTPIRRRQLLVDKVGAMVVTATALAAVLFVTLSVVGPPFDLTVPAVDLGCGVPHAASGGHRVRRDRARDRLRDRAPRARARRHGCLRRVLVRDQRARAIGGRARVAPAALTVPLVPATPTHSCRASSP